MLKQTGITLDNRIWLDAEGLPAACREEIETALTFRNPRRGMASMFGAGGGGGDVPDTFKAFSNSMKQLTLNRGWMADLIRTLQKHRIWFKLRDHTVCPEWRVVFTGDLTGAEVTALEHVCGRRFGVLQGPVKCGKRRVALAWICERRTPALVLVKTRMQLHQWKEDALALTTAGADEVGIVGDRLCQTERPLVISTPQSIEKHVDRLATRFGALVVDRVYAASLTSYEKVVSKMNSKFMLGLANTAGRGGFAGYARSFVGPVVHVMTRPDGSAAPTVRAVVKDTGWTYEYRDDYTEMITSVTADEARNRMIVEDIHAETADAFSRAVVVSDRVDHLQELAGMLILRDYGLIHGRVTPAAIDEIHRKYVHGKLQVILVTAKSLEKVAVNKCDRVFIACPLKFGGHTAQVVGLLARAGGDDPAVFDYRDDVPVLKKSLANRMRYYRKW